MSMGLGGSGGGRGGFDYLNSTVKARTRSGPPTPSDPVHSGRRRRLMKAVVAFVVVALAVVALVLAL